MNTIIFWSFMFVAIGAADFFGFTAYAFLFGKAGEELTMRLRYQSFKKYTGYVLSLLVTHKLFQGAIGARLGTMVQNISSLGCAFIIAFYFEWRLTLVCLGFIPLLIGSTAVMMSVFTGEAADKERAAFEEAGKCTTEASTNIQTVAALGQEPTFIEKYSVQLDVPLQSSIKETTRFRCSQHFNGVSNI